MSFRITGLSPEPFQALFALSDEELAARRARRVIADKKPGYPERIGLRDAEPGETLLLVNHTHQPANTPYRASHAVFVSEASRRYDRVGEIPEAIKSRLISLRAFDGDDMLVEAEVVHGSEIEAAIVRQLAIPAVSYLHAHFAAHGCFAARVERA